MNRSTVVVAALAAVAFACLDFNPAQGRLTQGSAPAPAPRSQTLASNLAVVASQPWISAPIDARRYHSLTLSLWSQDTTAVEVYLVARNDPSEPWCFVSSGQRLGTTLRFHPQVGKQTLPGSGQTQVISDLHFAEVALVFQTSYLGGANPPTYTVNASVYLE